MSARERSLYAIVTILWMALIFYLSSIPDLRSSLPGSFDYVLRKIAHMVEYGILYLLCARTLAGVRHRLLIAFVVTVAYAVSDELHQAQVPGRTASMIDVAIDGVGAFIGFYGIQKTSL